MATAKSGSTVVGRQELTRRIASQAKLTQKQAAEVLEATLDSIREALQNGNEVRLVGFGSFKVRKSAARKGVNPRDRQPIEVPAKERVRFSPGKELADAVVRSSKGGRYGRLVCMDACAPRLTCPCGHP
jgi:DNA-binding protein HU-beta